MALQDGVYQINSVFNGGRCIDIPSQHVGDRDGNVHQYNCNGTVFQQWRIKADPHRRDRYTIEWAGAGDKFLAPDGKSDDDGTAIKFYPRDDDGYQAWRLDDLGGGQYGIINDGSGKAIDFWSDDPDPGNNVRQKSYNPGVSQQRWNLNRIGG